MRQLPLEPIRQALNAGEFERAHFLWDECAAGLTGELSGGCLSAARLAEVCELVKWSRDVVLCERAHVLDQLNSLHVAAEYEMAPPRPTRRLVEASF